MKVIAWNCNRAGASRGLWPYLRRSRPDIALLQEVSGFPDDLSGDYSILARHAIRKDGSAQTFQTAVLAKGLVGTPIILRSGIPWADKELEAFSGNLLACEVELPVAGRFTVVSVHSPAWPVERRRLQGHDVSAIRLTQNRDVWVADLLWAALRTMISQGQTQWLIAGDFNCSETFDSWPGGPRGNLEYLERMSALGLVECLRHWNRRLTPTYINKGTGALLHQMDHLFATPDLASSLLSCEVGDAQAIMDERLSDHLPIVADFNRGGSRREKTNGPNKSLELTP